MNAETLPDVVLRIDDHGMRDAVAPDRVPYVLGILFGEELRRVDPHDDDGFALVARLDPGQDRQDMQAVDSAVGPEVEDGDAAAQILGHGERASRIEPREPGQELGTANRS